jgi:hypothetical protein
MAELHPWYNRQLWKGPRGLRLFILRRDPICCLCNRVYSEVADHIVPFRSGTTQAEQWQLFLDPTNLRGICAPCHNKLGEKTFATAAGPRQTGQQRARRVPGIVTLTPEGVPFVSSTLTTATLDAGLDPAAIKELLGNL